MDGDGKAEVILGAGIWDHAGAFLGLGSKGWGHIASPTDAFSAVADIDPTPGLEVVVNRALYGIAPDPSIWEVVGATRGAVAVADMDLDGWPDVVSIDGTLEEVRIRYGAPSHSGVVEVTWSTGRTDGGGTPTVDNFDDDPEPEIGIAFGVEYVVFDADGAEVWAAPTFDGSSRRTGSSVFDFEGDGIAEIVYADQEELFIFGQLGVNRLASWPDAAFHESQTMFEYPSLADVDGDGSTEILLASRGNDPSETEWTGVRAIGSATQSWMGSRPIWNQHAYHITNINDDGSVPATQVPNWDTWNNFRSADASSGVGAWGVNLYPSAPQYCDDVCLLSSWDMFVTVSNDGPVSAGAFVVEVLDDGVVVDTHTVIAGLGPGVSYMYPVSMDWSMWTGDLSIRVDWGDDVAECDEFDNVEFVGPYPCS
jgi:hypothetical protein